MYKKNHAVDRQLEVHSSQVWQGVQQLGCSFQNVVEASKGEQNPYTGLVEEGLSSVPTKRRRADDGHVAYQSSIYGPC